MRRLVFSCVLGAALLRSPAAAAQEVKTFPECTREASESDIAAAKGAFQAGQVSFQEADYERAILYWEDAFRRDCTALPMLLNLSRAYELSGNKPWAVSALETYLARNPTAPDKEQVSRRIEVLNTQIEKEREEAAAPPPPPVEKESPAPPPEQFDTSVDSSSLTDTEPGARPLWPLFVAGGGAALGLVGGILYLDANSDVKSYEERCNLPGDADFNCPTNALFEEAQDAQTRRTTWGVLSVVGFGVAAAGVITYFVLPPTSDDSVAVAPEVSPDFTGLSLSGAF